MGKGGQAHPGVEGAARVEPIDEPSRALYRILWPGEPPELVVADSVHLEGIYTVLRGTALVMGIPRHLVLRRVARHVTLEEVGEDLPKDQPSWTVG
jgi:hypothetical protein